MSAIDPGLTASVNGQIATIVGDLGTLDPKVTAEVTLDIGPVLQAGEAIAANVESYPEVISGLLDDLGKLDFKVKLSVAGDLVLSLQDARTLVKELRELFRGSGPVPGVAVPPLVRELAGDLVDAIPPGLRTRATRAGQQLTAATRDLLSHVLTGGDMETLTAAPAMIGGKSDEIAVAGRDAGPVSIRLTDLTVRFHEVIVLLTVDPPAKPDLAVILPKLAEIDAELDIVFRDLSPLIRKVARALDAIETEQLTDGLITAFDALAAVLPDAPFRLSPLFDPLREAAAELHDLTLAEIDQFVEDAVAEFRQALADSGIGQAAATVHEVIGTALQQIAQFQLQELRTQVDLQIAEALQKADDVVKRVPAAVHEALQEARTTIESFDASVLDTSELVTTMNAYTTGAAAAVGNLVTEIGTAVASADTGLKSLITELEAIDAQLVELANEVKSFDFDAAADESRRLIAEARTTVEEFLASGDLPAEAKSVLKLAAKELEKIDVREEVGKPIREELDKLDPEKLVARIEALVERLRETLRSIVPSEIVAQLDPPFDRALGALEELNPRELERRLFEHVDEVLAEIDRVDPAEVLDDLQPRYETLLDAVREHADLTPLFAQVQEPFDELRADIDALDLPALLADAAARLQALKEKLEEEAHAALAEAGEIAVASLPQDFHLGDLVRPLADLVQQLRAKLAAVSDAELEAAFLAVAGGIL